MCSDQLSAVSDLGVKKHVNWWSLGLFSRGGRGEGTPCCESSAYKDTEACGLLRKTGLPTGCSWSCTKVSGKESAGWASSRGSVPGLFVWSLCTVSTRSPQPTTWLCTPVCPVPHCHLAVSAISAPGPSLGGDALLPLAPLLPSSTCEPPVVPAGFLGFLSEPLSFVKLFPLCEVPCW